MDEIAEQLASRLEANPNDVQAYEELKAHYLRTQDLASLTNLIAGWAGYQTDPLKASRGYFEASRVVARAEPTHERRLALLRQAVALDAGYQEALHDLIELLPSIRDEQTLVGFLEEHIESMEAQGCAPSLLASAYAQLAASLGRLQQHTAASHWYERALGLDPSVEVIAEARATAQANSDQRLLAYTYGAEAEVEPDPTRKADLFFMQAKTLSRASDDPDEVVDALQKAYNVAPDNPKGSQRRELARELADAFAQRAASRTGEAAARDRSRAAELRCQVARASSPQEALVVLQAALRAQPDHEESLELLERYAEELGQEALLPQFWLAYMTRAPAGPAQDRRRLALARVYDRVGKLDEAISCLEQMQDATLAADLLAELNQRRRPRSQPLHLSASSKPPSDIDPRHVRDSSKPELRLDVEPTLRELRRALRNAIAAQRTSEIIERCREITAQKPNDVAAFTLLESHYRRAGQHEELIALLVDSVKPADLSLAERRLRLREVACLEERKRRDHQAAVAAWRAVLAVDPVDEEASRSLKRLLRRGKQWSELAELLEHEAAASSDPAQRAAALSELAAIQRDQLHDLPHAAESLRELYSLRPDPSTRQELCDALVESQAYADVVPLLRQRLNEAPGEAEQLNLLQQLADILETQLHEPEEAFEVCSQILALRPNDLDTLARMQRIDEHSGNAQRLLETLERRAALLPRQRRAELRLEMAKIAETSINDIDGAGSYYRAAYELDPMRPDTLDALCALYEDRELHADLVALLSEMIETTRDPARRVELGLRKARLLAGSMGASISAADAYREVLRYEENVEALQYLLDLAREQHDADTTASLCARLAALLEDRAECRALLFERAQLLVTELGRPRDAIITLRTIVEEVDPDYDPAIEWLAELAGNLGDNVGVASASWRRLEKSTNADARVALARRLADLHEHELDEKDSAITALSRWAEADPSDVAPQRRLRKLLEETGRYEELVATCDALAQLETDQNAREEATLRAALVSATHLKAPDAAWTRVAPLAARGNPRAMELLSSIARQTQRFDQLATLYVKAAQEATTAELQKLLWSQATQLYRDELGQPDKALDAALRLLASDLRNRDALAQIEESVTQLGQWPRLSNVYDRVIKAATHDHERTELLVRYAELLEHRAGKPDEALDMVLQACALSPDDEMLLSQAEKLAISCDRSADLLAMCDREAASSDEPDVQVEWLLRGARFGSATVEDRSATYAYLEAALAAARSDAALWERCVSLAQRLDAKTQDAEHSHLLALIAAHRKVAERSPAAIGVTLLRRASRLVEDKLGDERVAFDLLRAGATLFPLDENMYDSLLERAEATNHLDALDAHLARGVDEALDPRTAATLLARRARLLEGPLGRPDDAASVYAKLLQLRPDDQHAASKLRDSLRRARRFQDLLVVIHKQTQRANTNEEKIELLKETAQVWELDLRNRWEAVDAWGKVLELAPNDSEALRAMGRLDRRSVPPGHGRARVAASQPPAAESGRQQSYASDPGEVTGELETLEELDIIPETGPEPTSARRPTTAPPPPPPQAFQSSRPRPKTSAPPPPPPTNKPRSGQ